MYTIKHKITNDIIYEGGDLEEANLRGANLRGANLRGANLRGTNLEEANLRGANLRDANLEDANLRGANLRGANLWGANLWGANLRGANLWGANLRGANLWGANLWGANLWGIVGDSKYIKTVQLDTYTLVYTKRVVFIGCQCHTLEDWLSFEDDVIYDMDDGALDWWRANKHLVEYIIKHNPAKGDSNE